MLGEIIALVLGIIVLFIVFKFAKFLLKLVINSIAGLVLLWMINMLPFVSIPITFWNVLIVALGGVFGLALVIILPFLGYTI